MQEQLERAEAAVSALLANREDRWYPIFHLAPQAGWMNDPNGLSFFGGRYQVFYQHHPYSAEFGWMHWGHVSSVDMVTWRREPTALAPSIEEDSDGVYSGSAVISDDSALVVYYTGHRFRNGVDGADGNLEVQCMATSEDGVHFQGNHMIIDCPEDASDSRDPKVWRMGDVWYMIIGVCSPSKRGQVWLYTSVDMENWAFDRVLYEDPDPRVFMLECPDMFPLGDKWVLSYCPMGKEPHGYMNRNGHNAGYVMGEWEPGTAFTATTEYRPSDWGHNYYAPQSFETPDGRRIVFGWLGSFEVPLPSQAEDGWSGQLTVPRQLTLGEDRNLRTTPIAELAALRQETVDYGAFELDSNETTVLMEDAQAVEIEVEIDLTQTTAERVGFAVHKTREGDHTFVCCDNQVGRVTIDRRLTGNGDRGYRSAPFSGDVLRLHMFIDRSSIEVFVGEGQEVLTSCSFPGPGPRALEVSSESGTTAVTSLKVHTVGTIWEQPDR